MICGVAVIELVRQFFLTMHLASDNKLDHLNMQKAAYK